MDSGYCILKALIDLLNAGVFSSAVIKKRRYRPKYIPGDDIDKHLFDGKEVGVVGSLPSTLTGKAFKVSAMMEEDLVMKIMTTYGSCREVEQGATKRSMTDPTTGQKVTKTFNYYEAFYNHFTYRHQVDGHNNICHSPISLETLLRTNDWKVRVFSFVLALVEVNARLAYAYFAAKEPLTQIQFRRKLSKELINFSF